MRIARGKVHNPYHFVPVKKEGTGRVPVDEFRGGKLPRLSHDAYAPDTFSGRLLCRLRTEMPTFVGASRTREATPEQAGEVAPFERAGRPAIPASSLRGLVGSLAEAASNSALRVLSDRSLSFRRAAKEGLSAIGMVRQGRDEEGRPRLELLPLTLPTLEAGRGGAASLPREFWGLYGAFEPELRVYLGDRSTIRDPESFPYRTYRGDAERFFGLKLESRTWGRSVQGPTLDPDAHQHRKPIRMRGRDLDLVLAQRPTDGAEPRPWEEIPEAERPEYTRGILRVLGCWGRDDVPTTKKHELFLPYPEDAGTRHTVPIPEPVVETFYRAADERTEARGPEEGEALPYEPKDTRRNGSRDPEERRFRLKEGDLVFFQPSENGREVAEISLSSIWRSVPRKGRAAESGAASVHAFFESLDPELLPFHEGRTTLTPAEQLLGFVTRGRREDPSVPAAYRGRVRFSFATLEPQAEEPFYLDPCPLRVLANPKPPSPELYFKDRAAYDASIEKNAPPSGTFLRADDLNAAAHAPQGRKMYLHQAPTGPRPPWQSSPEHDGDLLQMRTEVRPLRPGLAFLFHVDFDNLGEDELGLLCYALRPTRRFRHKLGMGKPLGLGSVEIEPVGLFLVDRHHRYTDDGFFAPRYARAWTRPGEDAAAWPESYRPERPAPGAAETGAGDPAPEPPALAASFRQGMDPDVRQALELIGETLEPEHPVATPQVGGGDREVETYRWFVNNRHPHVEGQGLAPLSRSTRELPTLEEPAERE